MKSPKDMWAIQIEVTNACLFSCSNCTRFCGHHKKPFFMDWETFVRAVDSLEGFDQIVGIIGGEPTLHPQFERFIDHLSEKYGPRLKPNVLKMPMKPSEFAENVRVNQHDHYDRITADGNTKRAGLWSTMPNQYYKSYEKIHEIFGQQVLNDHRNNSIHQPILVSRKDLGITDEEWIPIRDKCWIQNQWSSSITPKGAFFCEVAAALDTLFDGPGGWRIEKGWWKREPEDFRDQIHWCEICGGALLDKGRLASDGIDDVSETLMKKIERVESPKFLKDHVRLIKGKDDNTDNEKMNSGIYLKNENDRLSNDNHVLCPRSISAIIPNLPDKPQIMNSSFVTTFKNVVTAERITYTNDDVSLFVVEQYNSEFQFGLFYNKLISESGADDWLYFTYSSENTQTEKVVTLKGMILNPGCVYWWNEPNESKHYLFSAFAQALKKSGFDGIAQCQTFDDFINLWEMDKVIELNDFFITFIED
ncbi:radical SAM protein [Desulfopila sp. IMCC35008]|uniref:radical SAM protein n=1 Tax=Desulfopila sp. IMCC35008 TaxID=2653858 RepID=UPI0013D81465|nr:radical SAM protein [Desulfopila sp. IMCC35008]